ncbi:hypothetical protein EDB81DRAFT_785406 [Dactylonectria macrodidyma]|uniref:Modin n=1 Tax=Dactylonectria macrodidyma TaxID=307937 RepID=A0A9P9JHJ5_9HYPO|nr:hypothetical protein EDB81DRAFT_785406 [Dactylonectria macrodidyma]
MAGADPEVVVALVALVISLVALAATFMQVMQQYYASAAGYSQCNPKVMGRWASTKTRRFSWDELRFEVEFHVPVIFVSPPSNKRGPVPNEPIYFLDGSQNSLDSTWSELSVDLVPRDDFAKRSHKEQVHTTDNERASWTMLLSAIQRMEKDSDEWQHTQYQNMGPPNNVSDQLALPPKPPSPHDKHTLMVALQRMRKSWDTMPATITRPFATTTMCHLIEMMGALGVYWKEFNRTHDRYRAEGNGFMLLGERVTDLGLMFSFRVYGKCVFERKRVIPVDEIKELCFGYVPTIYRETFDYRRLGFLEDYEQNIGTLQMASRSDISETLVLIGCNKNAVRCYTDPDKQTSHLFPVSLEVLGMLSQMFHIEDSSYTYIPNPTPDRWDKRALSLVKMLESYEQLVQSTLPGVARNIVILRKINYHVRQILTHHLLQDFLEQLRFLKALHAAIEDCDEILTAKARGSQSVPIPQVSGPRRSLGNAEGDRQGFRREIVLDVLRSHLQEVLRLLNDGDDRNTDNASLHADWAPSSPQASRFPDVPRPPPPTFEDMDAASPDDRQHKLMEVYFEVIRRKVVPHATSSTDRRASIVGAPPGYGFRRAGTGRTQASSIREASRTRNAMPPLPSSTLENGTTLAAPSVRSAANASLHEDNDSNVDPKEEPEPPVEVPLSKEEVSHDDVWCTLVFRMICWLMLHDFNKLDVQVSKSELLGSRMPVYIA